MSQYDSILSQHSNTAGDQAQDAKMTFDWTQKTKELLTQLLERLSKLIQAWESFKSSTGDISYFLDMISSQTPKKARA